MVVLKVKGRVPHLCAYGVGVRRRKVYRSEDVVPRPGGHLVQGHARHLAAEGGVHNARQQGLGGRARRKQRQGERAERRVIAYYITFY